jgi:phage host-nuclease inhibitor protein Gam
MTMNKKSKLTVIPCANRAEAEAAVSEFARLVNNQRAITAIMDAEILGIKERFGASLAECEAARKIHAERLKLWALANPEEFGKARSIQFTAGAIGFRTGMPRLALLNRSWTWEKCLATVEQLLPGFIRQKPEIDAAALINQRGEEMLQLTLPKCGLKIVQDQGFYLDPKLELLAAPGRHNAALREAA